MSHPPACGVSGVFIAAQDPAFLADWYSRHFGVSFHLWKERQSYGAEFIYRDTPGHSASRESTVLVFEPAQGERPDNSSCRLQYRVEDMSSFLGRLVEAGVPVDGSEDFSYGRFAWIRDPEGNRVELYQPL